MSNKFFALPEGTPKNIVETYRTAARDILKDPEFAKKAGEIVGGYEQVVGDDALPIIREATSMSPEAWNWLDAWLQKNYDLPLVQQPKEEKKNGKKDDKKEKEAEVKIDPKDRGEVKRFGPTTDDPYAVAWSPKSKTLAICGYSGQITIWDLKDPKPRFTHTVKSPGYCIAFTADGKAVITGHDNGTVAVTAIGSK